MTETTVSGNTVTTNGLTGGSTYAVIPTTLPNAAQTESPATAAKDAEHMIPKSRLDEVIAKAEKAEKALLKFQEAEDKRKKDELSELDRLKLEKQEAETRAQNAANELLAEREKNTIYAEANKAQFGEGKAKFAEPEVAYKLLDPELKEKGILQALQELAKKHPYLLEAAQPSKGDGVGSPAKGKKINTDDIAQSVIDQKRRGYAPL